MRPQQSETTPEYAEAIALINALMQRYGKLSKLASEEFLTTPENAALRRDIKSMYEMLDETYRDPSSKIILSHKLKKSLVDFLTELLKNTYENAITSKLQMLQHASELSDDAETLLMDDMIEKTITTAPYADYYQDQKAYYLSELSYFYKYFRELPQPTMTVDAINLPNAIDQFLTFTETFSEKGGELFDVLCGFAVYKIHFIRQGCSDLLSQWEREFGDSPERRHWQTIVETNQHDYYLDKCALYRFMVSQDPLPDDWPHWEKKLSDTNASHDPDDEAVASAEEAMLQTAMLEAKLSCTFERFRRILTEYHQNLNNQLVTSLQQQPESRYYSLTSTPSPLLFLATQSASNTPSPEGIDYQFKTT